MTIMKAERLTGYQIRELRLERDNVTFGAFDGSILWLRLPAVEWMALKSLVHHVYLFAQSN